MILENPIRWTDPGTWPWFFYVWIALFLASGLKPLRRWIQRNRATRWPNVMGEIQSVAVNEPKPYLGFIPRRNSPGHVAELGYAYSVAGKAEVGIYRREFWTAGEAWEFLRDLKGKTVAVQYNPDRPSSSTLSETSLDTLLHTRAPNPAGEFSFAVVDAVPDWLKPFLQVLIGMAGLGLALSLWVHLGAVVGRQPAPFFWILHVGIFVVWFPTVLIARKQLGNVNRRDFWKVVLKSSPEWARYAVYGFFAYAVINFLMLSFQNRPTENNGANPPALEWRLFSGHWMAFYSAALAILSSAARQQANLLRCSNGHPVSPSANFCGRCGQPAIRF